MRLRKSLDPHLARFPEFVKCARRGNSRKGSANMLLGQILRL